MRSGLFIYFLPVNLIFIHPRERSLTRVSRPARPLSGSALSFFLRVPHSSFTLACLYLECSSLLRSPFADSLVFVHAHRSPRTVNSAALCTIRCGFLFILVHVRNRGFFCSPTLVLSLSISLTPCQFCLPCQLVHYLPPGSANI